MTEQYIVANASPFIALERIGQPNLLPTLVKQLWIPPAVRREVFASKPLPDWVIETSLQQPLAPRMVSARLGNGEREAIALAPELQVIELIIDDLPARRLATSLGLPIIGTVGLLLRAKKMGLISVVRPLLEDLQAQDFRISERLFEGILAAAEEK